MDINDPRYRLKVLNQSNPSIRIATAPAPQQSIRVSSPPVSTPNIVVPGAPRAPVSTPGSQPTNSWNKPTAPKQGFFGKLVSNTVNPFAKLGNDIGALGSATGDLARVGIANITNNPIARRNALNDKTAQKLTAGGGGLLHQGGALGGDEVTNKGAVFIGPNAKKNIEKTVGTGGQIGSLFAGGGSTSLVRGAIAGAGAGAIGSAGNQLAENGKLMPRKHL
jgi:hypothetical protein